MNLRTLALAERYRNEVIRCVGHLKRAGDGTRLEVKFDGDVVFLPAEVRRTLTTGHLELLAARGTWAIKWLSRHVELSESDLARWEGLLGQHIDAMTDEAIAAAVLPRCACGPRAGRDCSIDEHRRNAGEYLATLV